MLPRKARVPIGVFLRARPRSFYSSPVLTLKAKKNGIGYNRYGVVISAAVEPRAYRRHRLKRQVLGVVRAWPLCALDHIFILGRAAPRISSSALRRELGRALASVIGTR